MPEQRGRSDLAGQVGTSARTTPGSSAGAGLTQTVERIARTARNATQGAVGVASSLPSQFRYEFEVSTTRGGGPETVELPTGHRWNVHVQSDWTGGFDGDPEGRYSVESQILAQTIDPSAVITSDARAVNYTGDDPFGYASAHGIDFPAHGPFTLTWQLSVGGTLEYPATGVTGTGSITVVATWVRALHPDETL